MKVANLRPYLAYAGIPVICVSLLLLHSGNADGFSLLCDVLLVIFGYTASVFDARSKRIPNSLICAMLASWVIILIPQLFLNTDSAISLAKDSALGFSIGGGLFLIMYIVSRKGLGAGDVKFMAAAGLYLGFYGVLPAMLLGTILAAITGLCLVLTRKIRAKDAIPLVPFIFAGITVVLLLQ